MTVGSVGEQGDVSRSGPGSKYCTRLLLDVALGSSLYQVWRNVVSGILRQRPAYTLYLLCVPFEGAGIRSRLT